MSDTHAHPPSSEHPSPATTPGTTGISTSPVAVMASEDTGKTISASTPETPLSARRESRLHGANDGGHHARLCAQNEAQTLALGQRALDRLVHARARVIQNVLRRSDDAESASLASMASLNISPGTSKCAVWYASP